MLWMLLVGGALSGDINCLSSVWKDGGFRDQDLEWIVGDRRLYDLWDASARWQSVGGAVLESPDGARWRVGVLSCGYTLTWPDKTGK